MVRQSGASQEQVLFRDLLRLWNGESNEKDCQLLSRSSSAITNLTEFNDAVHLFYNKDKVAQFNAQKLNSLGTPIARINAVYSCSSAASAKTDDAGGLEPVLLPAKGARVMLKSNLWAQKACAMEPLETSLTFYMLQDKGPLTYPLQYLCNLINTQDHHLQYRILPAYLFHLFHLIGQMDQQDYHVNNFH